MNRTERLTGIVLVLRGGRKTVRDLAERFEVSRRTILRDIAGLCEIGVPLITTPGVGGGVEIAEGYWLPPLHFTAAEAGVLLLGLQGLGADRGVPLAAERRSAEEKLRAALRPDVAGAVERDLAAIAVMPPSRPVEPGHFETLRAAIERGSWVRATYQSSRRIAEHTLWPLGLDLEEGRWYCAAVPAGGDGRRRYRLDRFVAIHRCPDPPGARETLASLANPVLPYDDPSYPEVVVHLTYAGMRRAEDERGWADHLTPLGDGRWELRYRCPSSEYPYYARVIFALGGGAEAKEPAAFRELVRQLVASAVERYREA